MRLLLLLILALPLCAQDVPMRFYGMAILEQGPKWTKEGKLILAGPLAEAGAAAGIFVFDTASIDETRKWCDSDPAVAGGHFQVKLWRWYSAKGIGILAAGQ